MQILPCAAMYTFFRFDPWNEKKYNQWICFLVGVVRNIKMIYIYVYIIGVDVVCTFICQNNSWMIIYKMYVSKKHLIFSDLYCQIVIKYYKFTTVLLIIRVIVFWSIHTRKGCLKSVFRDVFRKFTNIAWVFFSVKQCLKKFQDTF